MTFPHITKRTAAAAATTALTAAATIMALAPAPVLADTSPSSAAGILTSGLGLAPLSTVSSNGKAEDSSLLSTPSSIPALTASVLHVFADGAQGTARASAADLNIGSGQLIASLVTASCKPGGGDATLLNAIVAGHAIPVAPPPNTTIAVPPGVDHIVAITLNKQVKNSQGGLTVTAIEVQLGTGSAEKTIDISTANCAAPTAHTSPGTPTSPSVPAAPAPTPQRGTLPVTG
jgi:hypothetical protein